MRADIEILEHVFLFTLIFTVLPYSPKLIREITVRGIEIQNISLFRKVNRSINGLDILLAL